jgi:hypothetical protein
MLLSYNLGKGTGACAEGIYGRGSYGPLGPRLIFVSLWSFRKDLELQVPHLEYRDREACDCWN